MTKYVKTVYLVLETLIINIVIVAYCSCCFDKYMDTGVQLFNDFEDAQSSGNCAWIYVYDDVSTLANSQLEPSTRELRKMCSSIECLDKDLNVFSIDDNVSENEVKERVLKEYRAKKTF